MNSFGIVLIALAPDLVAAESGADPEERLRGNRFPRGDIGCADSPGPDHRVPRDESDPYTRRIRRIENRLD